MDNTTKRVDGRAVTIGDIAQELQLSTATISRAISGKGRIGEATRKRVLTYIEARNYKPNAIAKGLAQSKTYNIGVVLPSEKDQERAPFFQGCLLGVCEAAAGYDYDVVVTTAAYDNLAPLKRLIENQKVDGMILTRTYTDDNAIRYLKQCGLPFVTVGSTQESDVWQVDCDHTAGCGELTGLLYMLGNHRMALLIGSMEHIVNQSRREGYLRALEQRGAAAENALIYADLSGREQVYRAVEAAIARDIDCILCADDRICSAVLTKLKAVGISVPEQLRVASFYNSAALEDYTPPITALDVDVKGIGRAAGEGLLALLHGQEQPQRTLIDYELLLRASTK